MRMDTKIDGNSLTVTLLEPRVDAHLAPALRKALIDHVDNGHEQLLVDMSQVDFIDSSGLGALVSALKRIGRDGELKVRALTPPVKSMFELTRLDRVITIAA